MPQDKTPIRRGPDGRIQHIDVKALLDRPNGFGALRAALLEIRSGLPNLPEQFDQPPWLLRPDMPRDSLGWRMGGGEDLLDAFETWFLALTAQERLAFCTRYPEPADWEGFYASLT
ncbi:hypothetical protein [Ponticoccus alexandrii]|uniref:Uncharacterized protein n=1 Tax=Ponticoccus alexandrii TaxID=1943633 RepID=A0ABX7FAE4_9RHOB|nr:hypothetical protein [Ponticoccus alexandrii]ETA51480.1 hypothetical protein P279_13830 [Rhodobacteraceae bacterium PD-2]QRF66519.1 hypothetical protein GQA70_09485 [Ponticoccus alexandrii]